LGFITDSQRLLPAKQRGQIQIVFYLFK